MKIKKRPAGRKWTGLLAFTLAPMVVLASPSVASASSQECLGNSSTPANADIAGNWSTQHQTRSVTVQQARKTWQDWVYRGDLDHKTFQCPWNVPSCSYAWQQSKTTGWKWSVGLNVKVPSVLSKAVSELAALTPSYERNGSITTAFTWTITLKPGQKAAPIQVVERRWTQGVYQGIYHSTGKSCLPTTTDINAKPHFYTWDPNARWGSWTTNMAVSDWATYNVWS
ncbi:hypothetical protein DF19_08690 [Streptomyces olindensis]|nr:hypothetical protein DF19_18630 [Streptomyces olindensis]KDN77662.1 hypothetical protein DF19_08690 [Streptomyces olindensis]